MFLCNIQENCVGVNEGIWYIVAVTNNISLALSYNFYVVVIFSYMRYMYVAIAQFIS